MKHISRTSRSLLVGMCVVVLCIGGWWLYVLDVTAPQLHLTLIADATNGPVVHVEAHDNQDMDASVSYSIGDVVQGAQFGVITGSARVFSANIPLFGYSEEQMSQLRAHDVARVTVTAHDRAGNVAQAVLDVDADVLMQ